MSYKITFIGTGIIGAGLASNAILRDFDVTLFVRGAAKEAALRETLEKIFGILIDAGATTREIADEKMAKVKFSYDLAESVRGADFVQESISERLELKKETYRTIQETVGKNVIICSSTSALFPSKLSEGAVYPENILVGHPYNPSYLLPLIEICGGPTGSPAAIDKAKKVYTAMGKVPIVCRQEINGFIVNRLSWAALDAAKESIVKGVCSVEDMDKAIIFGPGMRMAVTGQLLTMSLGVDGGFREMAKKYGKEPDPADLLVADGIDEELANRTVEQGNTPETVELWRDKMFVNILKLHGML